MNEQITNRQISLLRKMQALTPIALIVAALLVHMFWSNPSKPILVGVLALMAVIDYVAFAIIIRQMERQQ